MLKAGLVLSATINSIEVFVPQEIQTLNDFLGKAASVRPFGWHNYCKKWAVSLCLIRNRKAEPIKAFTTIVSHRGRLLDKENLYGGCKPIRDALKRRGWLHDDSPHWGDVTVWQTLKPFQTYGHGTYIKVLLDRAIVVEQDVLKGEINAHNNQQPNSMFQGVSAQAPLPIQPS